MKKIVIYMRDDGSVYHTQTTEVPGYVPPVEDDEVDDLYAELTEMFDSLEKEFDVADGLAVEARELKMRYDALESTLLQSHDENRKEQMRLAAALQEARDKYRSMERDLGSAVSSVHALDLDNKVQRSAKAELVEANRKLHNKLDEEREIVQRAVDLLGEIG